MSAPAHTDRSGWVIYPVILAGALTIGWALWMISRESLSADFFCWLVLLGVTILAGPYSFRIPGTQSVVSISDFFSFIALLLFGIPEAVLTTSLDAVVSTRRKTRKKSNIAFSVSTMALAILFSGSLFCSTYRGLSDVPLGLAGAHLLILPLLVLTMTQYGVNALLVAIVVHLRYGRPIWVIMKDELLWTATACVGSGSAAAIGFLLIQNLGYSAMLLVAPIVLVTYFSFRSYTDKIEEKNKHIQEIAKVHISTIECLATAIDAKDQVTHGHIRRVQLHTVEMARLLKVTDLELEGLRAAALLHDIGKLAIPEYILNKPARLTTKEFEKIKTHTIVGAEILSAVEFPYPVIPGVLHHHERWDGKGYPAGLKGEEIPLAARVLSMVDFYDALTNDRPYRKAMKKEEVLRIIREEAGKMFDPTLVELFASNIDRFEEMVQAAENAAPRLVHRLPKVEESPEESGCQPKAEVLGQIAAANQEMMTLYEIAKNLGRSLEVKDVLAIIGNKLEKLVPYTDLVIYLWNDDVDRLVASHVSGPHGQAFRDHRIARGQGVTGWALANHRMLANADPTLDFDKDRLEKMKDLKSVTVFPLCREQENIGCLAFYAADHPSLNDDHLRILDDISQQIAEALANVLAFQQTRHDAMTDSLTGLPNSRSLYFQGEREIAQAQRNAESLSLIVIDLDRFKEVNDTWGHQQGDQLLRQVSAFLKWSVRDSDTLVRYAGDEFIVLLPKTAPDEAQSIMKRIQALFSETSFDLDSCQQLVLGMSVGCSSYPEDGSTLEDLIVSADRRMYGDKQIRRLVPRRRPIATSSLSEGQPSEPPIPSLRVS